MNNEKEIRFIEMFCGVGGFRLGLERTNRNKRRFNNKEKSKATNGDIEKTDVYNKKCSPAFRCVWANDNDKYACQIYRKRFGNRSKLSKPRDGAKKGRIGLHSEGNSDGSKKYNYGVWDEASKLLEGDIRKIQASSIPEHDLLTAGFPCQTFSIAGKRKGFEDKTRGTLFHEICRVARSKRTRYLLLENVKGLFSHDGGRTFAIILLSLDELGYDVEWQVLNTKYWLPQNRERVFIFGTRREGE